MDRITIKASDGLELKGFEALVDNPKAVIQIVHGMVEHKERYEYLIGKLNEAGYSAVIFDLRGHGESINEEYILGHIGTSDQMVEDEYTINQYIKSKNKDVPVYMFAHSMGSIIGRAFLTKHDVDIDKLILSGTVAYKPGCGLGALIAKRTVRKQGPKGYSKALWKMSNNNSNDPSLDWLSYNEENVKNYMNDPLCSFYFTNHSNHVLFSMTHDLHKKIIATNPNMPIISITGKDDRTTNGTKGVIDSCNSLKKRGYKNVSYIEIPGMKHETLMELERDKVVKEILKFYEA